MPKMTRDSKCDLVNHSVGKLSCLSLDGISNLVGKMKRGGPVSECVRKIKGVGYLNLSLALSNTL